MGIMGSSDEQLEKSAGRFVDLFAGCGGLSLGLMRAGWKGLFAIEKEAFAFETLKSNLIGSGRRFSFDWPAWLPQKRCTIGRFLRKYQEHIADLLGRVDLVAGGPPCQGFSFAGRRNRHDVRNKLLHRYIQVVRLIRPRFLLVENVVGITVEFGKKERAKKKSVPGRRRKSFAQRLVEQLNIIGYHVETAFVKAADLGVPQHRPRFILLGIRKDNFPNMSLELSKAVPELRNGFLKEKGLPFDRLLSVKEAISDLETDGKELVECTDSPGFKQVKYQGPQTTYQKLLHEDLNGSVPNSMRLANHRRETVRRYVRILKTCRHGVQLSVRDRKRFALNKKSLTPLHADKPAHTLTTLPDDLLHYAEPRILTAREYARIQSFPDWYEFCGKYSTGGLKRRVECPRYTQIGNAVPPHLSEFLGIVLKKIPNKI